MTLQIRSPFQEFGSPLHEQRSRADDERVVGFSLLNQDSKRRYRLNGFAKPHRVGEQKLPARHEGENPLALIGKQRRGPLENAVRTLEFGDRG